MKRLLLLLACGLVVACGSDDGDADAAEYREVVERMCRQAERAGERLANRIGDDPEDALRFFRGMLSLSRRYQERSERVDPPAELADQHERSLELGRRGIVIVEELVAALERADDPAVAIRRKFPPLLRLTDESNELAREMKLEDCVAGPIVPEPDPVAPS